MGDSTKISVDNMAWVNISNGATGGYMSNQGNSSISFIESNSTPDDSDTDGHTLVVDGDISFILEAGQDVYARASNGTTELEFTPQ